MSYLDTNGIMMLEETDPISPFQTLMNGMQAATSTAFGELITTVEELDEAVDDLNESANKGDTIVINGVSYVACGLFTSLPSYEFTYVNSVGYTSFDVTRPYAPPTGWGFVPYIARTARVNFVSVTDSSASPLNIRIGQLGSGTVGTLQLGWQLLPR